MNIVFRTNVDAGKRLVELLEPVEGTNPLVGDLINVYDSHDAVIKMKVVSRTWTSARGHGHKVDTLEIELNIPDYMTITSFTHHVRSAGLPIHG